MNDVRPGQTSYALSAFRPHVRAPLRSKFQCGIVGQGSHHFSRLRSRTLRISQEAPHPDANRERPGPNRDDVFCHCWPPYRLQCRNDANVAVATTLKVLMCWAGCLGRVHPIIACHETATRFLVPWAELDLRVHMQHRAVVVRSSQSTATFRACVLRYPASVPGRRCVPWYRQAQRARPSARTDRAAFRE